MEHTSSITNRGVTVYALLPEADYFRRRGCTGTIAVLTIVCLIIVCVCVFHAFVALF